VSKNWPVNSCLAEGGQGQRVRTWGLPRVIRKLLEGFVYVNFIYTPKNVFLGFKFRMNPEVWRKDVPEHFSGHALSEDVIQCKKTVAHRRPFFPFLPCTAMYPDLSSWPSVVEGTVEEAELLYCLYRPHHLLSRWI
jgi:hypothetical protein